MKARKNCYNKEKKKNEQKYIGKIENPSRSLKHIMFGDKWRHEDGRNSISFNKLPLYVIEKINSPGNRSGGKVMDNEEIKHKAEPNKNKAEIKCSSGIPVSSIHMPSTRLLGFTLIRLMSNLFRVNSFSDWNRVSTGTC